MSYHRKGMGTTPATDSAPLSTKPATIGGLSYAALAAVLLAVGGLWWLNEKER